MIFDCDPLVEKPTIFYYRADFDVKVKLPKELDHYVNNKVSIETWVGFIRNYDSGMGKLEFLENLNEQELRDEMFVDGI